MVELQRALFHYFSMAGILLEQLLLRIDIFLLCIEMIARVLLTHVTFSNTLERTSRRRFESKDNKKILAYTKSPRQQLRWVPSNFNQPIFVICLHYVSSTRYVGSVFYIQG